MPDWRRLSWADRVAWVIGTGFGSGFSPIAPGTAGSAAAGALFLALIASWSAPAFGYRFLVVVCLSAVLIGFLVGVWATGRMSTATVPDPGAAVWDEFVGMWVACLPIVLLAYIGGPLLPPLYIVVPFIVFRALDILKPWPCRSLERLHGGWGIMLDDVAAGIWSFLGISVVLAIWAVTGELFGN